MVDWRGRRRSSNVEDGRGARGARGGRRRAALPAGGFKLKGGLGVIALVAVVYLAGGDVSQILGLLLGGGMQSPAPATSSPATFGPTGSDEAAQFVSVILADTEDTWNAVFRERGQRYPEPKLRLFSDGVDSACGYNSSAVGPFYCPGDQRVYLDLTFFDQLRQMGAPGDFAQAYVIGHEVGHHVQYVTGVLTRVQRMKQGRSQAEANALQVLVELQADCYAGLWAHHAEAQRDLLERGDVEEGLRAAASIGDDALMKRAGRRVRPESFTHGSSKQRTEWFQRGMRQGTLEACDTFAAAGRGDAQAAVAAPRRAAKRTTTSTNAEIRAAFEARRSDVQVRGEGTVQRVLSDDNEGSRHQRFILDIGAGHTLLVAHNIDLAPRLDGLRAGERVSFYGEYEYNDRGGVLHWTHHDPRGRHPGGWLKYRGRTYE